MQKSREAANRIVSRLMDECIIIVLVRKRMIMCWLIAWLVVRLDDVCENNYSVDKSEISKRKRQSTWQNLWSVAAQEMEWNGLGEVLSTSFLFELTSERFATSNFWEQMKRQKWTWRTSGWFHCSPYSLQSGSFVPCRSFIRVSHFVPCRSFKENMAVATFISAMHAMPYLVPSRSYTTLLL